MVARAGEIPLAPFTKEGIGRYIFNAGGIGCNLFPLRSPPYEAGDTGEVLLRRQNDPLWSPLLKVGRTD